MKCVNISGDDYSNDELEVLEHLLFFGLHKDKLKIIKVSGSCIVFSPCELHLEICNQSCLSVPSVYSIHTGLLSIKCHY